MASMVGLFVPEDMRRWPATDPRDPTYQRDLASLELRGEPSGAMPATHHAPGSETPGAHAGTEDTQGHDGAAGHSQTGHESHE
jgi:hypothetical protein